MSNAITTFLLNALSGGIETVGESKLEDLLQQLHDHHPEFYEPTLKAGHAFASTLQTLVAGSATKIDDAIVAGIIESIVASAAANNVTL